VSQTPGNHPNQRIQQANFNGGVPVVVVDNPAARATASILCRRTTDRQVAGRFIQGVS